jgi:SAM-dependent methyltransferase
VERLTVPDDRAPLQEWLVYLMHEATYRWADPYVRDRPVLDLGCGTGYGTASLAGIASRVVGVDVSGEAIRLATAAFGSSGAEFTQVADPSRHPLPFADGSFDAVVSFQVIEHLDRSGAYLAEASRVLAPGGVLLLATPDRATRLYPWQKPWNRFHVTEFDGPGLQRALAAQFANSEVLGMTLAPEFVGHEQARVRQARLMSLPFTVPRAPDVWRKAGLRLMTGAVALAARRRPPPPPAAVRPTIDVVSIGPAVEPRLFRMAVAHRAGDPPAAREPAGS